MAFTAVTYSKRTDWSIKYGIYKRLAFIDHDETGYTTCGTDAKTRKIFCRIHFSDGTSQEVNVMNLEIVE